MLNKIIISIVKMLTFNNKDLRTQVIKSLAGDTLVILGDIYFGGQKQPFVFSGEKDVFISGHIYSGYNCSQIVSHGCPPSKGVERVPEPTCSITGADPNG